MFDSNYHMTLTTLKCAGWGGWMGVGGGGGRRGILYYISTGICVHLLFANNTLMCVYFRPVSRKPDFVACDQQRRRQACVSAQSYQRIRYSLWCKL